MWATFSIIITYITTDLLPIIFYKSNIASPRFLFEEAGRHPGHGLSESDTSVKQFELTIDAINVPVHTIGRLL